MSSKWTPDLWRSKPAAQQPSYEDAAAADQAFDELRRLPPLVTSWEVESLKAQLAEQREANGSCCKVATVARALVTATRV